MVNAKPARSTIELVPRNDQTQTDVLIRRMKSTRTALLCLIKFTVGPQNVRGLGLALALFLITSVASPVATAEVQTTDFDHGEWRTGLLDVRQADLKNARLVSYGYSNAGLKVSIPRGGFRGLGPFKSLPPETDEAWYRYHIRLTNFAAKSSGKLPGLAGLYSSSGRGCHPSVAGEPGWSARGLFGAAGSRGAPAGEIPVGTYLYHLDQPGQCGELLFWEDSYLKPGRWHCIEGHVKLNSFDEKNGVVEGWLDGSRRFVRTGLGFRREDETGIGIREMWLNIYYGGKKPTGQQLDLMIDEVTVSTTQRVGCIDADTNLVGSFNAGTTSSIASYSPVHGAWTLRGALDQHGSSESMANFKTGDGWTQHLSADLNGDGRDEIASLNRNGTWWVTTRSEDKYEATKGLSVDRSHRWGTHLAGDFTGDGGEEIASYEAESGRWWLLRPQWNSPFPGTGRDQARVLSMATAQNVHALAKELAVNDFQSFLAENWGSFRTTNGWSEHLVGDFNGDGIDDVANYMPLYGTWYVSVSNGKRFRTSRWSRYDIRIGWSKQLVGDFNGDGRDDVANYNPERGGWWVSLSDGKRFITTRWSTFGIARGWTNQLAGDFNGDGMDDIANYNPERGGWWVSLSDGEGFSTRQWNSFNLKTGWTDQIRADFNGDGLDDVANYHAAEQAWWISLSTGTSFETTRRSG